MDIREVEAVHFKDSPDKYSVLGSSCIVVGAYALKEHYLVIVVNTAENDIGISDVYC
jgi:hypothetical protein